MRDADCVDFLQWALPRLRMHWQGFRKVRGQVCKRIARRVSELGLADLNAYRCYLESHAEEWKTLDAACRITISRFLRDCVVFQHLADELLPQLARGISGSGAGELRAWSAGCGAGAEAYTLTILWRLRMQLQHPGVSLHVLATDADAGQLQRARAARYSSSSLRELPPKWRARAFVLQRKKWQLRSEFQAGIEWRRQDIRLAQPREAFHIILCRNSVFTYFDESLQCEVAEVLARRLVPGGVLILASMNGFPVE